MRSTSDSGTWGKERGRGLNISQLLRYTVPKYNLWRRFNLTLTFSSDVRNCMRPRGYGGKQTMVREGRREEDRMTGGEEGSTD